MTPQTVSILGCGWLGWPLAKRFIQLGFRVQGSTTTPSKIPLLRNDFIEPFLIECGQEVRGSAPDNFFKADFFVIDIPFKRDLEDPQFYFKQMQAVSFWLEKSGASGVIFTSSTSIYPNSCQATIETDNIALDDARSKVLFEVEQMFLKNKSFKTTVLRFAGLFGPSRHPGKFPKRNLELSREVPLNLVHLDDCIGIVERVIQKGVWAEVFNVCADEHPLRKDFYAQASILLGKPMPELTDRKEAYKIVSNDKVKKALGYAFKYPDPVQALKFC